MRGNDEQLVRLPAERRNALSDAGLPVHGGVALDDATVLVPRSRRDGERSSTLYHRDLHLLGRAYGRDDMFVRSDGPWRALQTSPGAVTVVPAGCAATFDVLKSNDYSVVLLPDARLQACADELGGGRRVELWDRIAVEDPITSRLLELVDHELTRDDGASTLFIERSLDLLCMQLLRGHGRLEARPVPVRRPSRRGRSSESRTTCANASTRTSASASSQR